MDASVVISAIHRHICHTVNIVNVIYFILFFYFFIITPAEIFRLSLGMVKFFFSGYVHANLNDIYLFRNSSTLEVVFDDRLLFLHSRMDANRKSDIYLWWTLL